MGLTEPRSNVEAPVLVKEQNTVAYIHNLVNSRGLLKVYFRGNGWYYGDGSLYQEYGESFMKPYFSSMGNVCFLNRVIKLFGSLC